MRSNPLIWRLARYLYDNFDMVGRSSIWDNESLRNAFYDKAVILYWKIVEDKFTGEDNID